MNINQTTQTNEGPKIIILCENCCQKLRLPILAPGKKLKVTCPKCKHEFTFKYDPKDPRHYEHEFLSFGIVHQDSNLNKVETHVIGPEKKTYAYWRSEPMPWDLTRPKSGYEKFQFTCPHCGKELEVTLRSFELMAKARADERKLKKILVPVSIITALFSVAIMIIASKQPTLLGHWDLLGLLIFPSLFIFFFCLFYKAQDLFGGLTNLQTTIIPPTLSGHYIGYIESR
jgi:hypothetical protein